jgi:hypothetical protein
MVSLDFFPAYFCHFIPIRHTNNNCSLGLTIAQAATETATISRVCLAFGLAVFKQLKDH